MAFLVVFIFHDKIGTLCRAPATSRYCTEPRDMPRGIRHVRQNVAVPGETTEELPRGMQNTARSVGAAPSLSLTF